MTRLDGGHSGHAPVLNCCTAQDDKNANEYARNPLRYNFGRIIQVGHADLHSPCSQRLNLMAGLDTRCLLQMNLRGAACFDWDLYYRKNRETLQFMESKEQAWTHFVNNGQFSGEAFRCARGWPIPQALG